MFLNSILQEAFKNLGSEQGGAVRIWGSKNIFPSLLLKEHTMLRQLLCFFAFLSDSLS